MGRWFIRFAGTSALFAALPVAPTLSRPAPPSADTVSFGCTIVSNPTPTHFTDCPNWNSEGTSLADVNLAYANLPGSFYADCSGSIVQPVTCVSSDLSNADLSHANLTGASFSTCLQVQPDPEPNVGCGTATLTGANLSLANLSNVNFDTVDLTDADFTGANLTGASMGEDFPPFSPSATLTGANFTATILVPPDVTATATSSSGAVASWTTPSGLPGAAPGSCVPPSGSTFPLYSTTVTCQVLDAANDVATGTFQVSVLPTTQYFSRLLVPSSGAALAGKAIFDAEASDGPGVTKVQYELTGGTLHQAVIATGISTLYGWLAYGDTTTVPNGTYTLQSVATDAANNVSRSTGISVTITNAPATTVGLPANGATVSGGQWLDASASPGVTKVVYEISGGTLSDDVIATATPTSVGWLAGYDFSTVPNGTYTLQSVATAGGLSGTSAGITIMVSH
jgi:uncharacterized protein YjbI with pentapeptide repeats